MRHVRFAGLPACSWDATAAGANRNRWRVGGQNEWSIVKLLAPNSSRHNLAQVEEPRIVATPPVVLGRSADVDDAVRVVYSRSVVSRGSVSVPVERNGALDYVKGALVMLMVLYHWLNYFIGAEWSGYRYLRFLTPSFIFITGFLVSHVYLARYPADSRMLRRRLVQRGTKLLLLFGVLNLADTAVSVHGYEISLLVKSWPVSRIVAVFVTGEAGASFSILVPIAYLLMLAPAVIVHLETERRVAGLDCCIYGRRHHLLKPRRDEQSASGDALDRICWSRSWRGPVPTDRGDRPQTDTSCSCICVIWASHYCAAHSVSASGDRRVP